jgi:CRISPR/Cas system CSM-associated protein Csm3 (group 7 of RAMP superfamily)
VPTLKGKIIAQAPIYRGNSIKTLFSRDNKQKKTPIELPGRPDFRNPGKMRMDAFTGFTDNRNRYLYKLLDTLYNRLFQDRNPQSFFRNIKISCIFNDPRPTDECFYDMRMGIKLNRDRMSMEENANYKMETVFKGTRFDFSLDYPSSFQDEEKTKLYLLLNELVSGRFWFGAGKTKGLGNIRLELDPDSQTAFEKLKTKNIPIKNTANIVEVQVEFNLSNPLLVGWQFNDEGADDTQKDKEGYQRKVAGWIDQEIQNKQAHLEIKKQIASGKIKNLHHIKDEQFKREHTGRNGRPIPLNPTSFKKAVTNDENLSHFLSWYRSKVQSEIGQEKNCDYRQNKKDNRTRKSHTPYDRIFMRMLKWKNPVESANTGWEVYVPGGTIKGAFRVKAEKIIRTLINQQLNHGRLIEDGLIADLFGKQNSAGKVIFSDAYLTKKENPCSLDAVKIDPKTGEPIKEAKMDFLYQYGADLSFKTSFFLNDIRDDAAMGLFFHLLQDMENGQIPLGGQKTSGMGWVKGDITCINIRTGRNGHILKQIQNFGKQAPDKDWLITQGLFSQLKETSLYRNTLKSFEQRLPGTNRAVRPDFNFSASRNLISHAAYSGYSGNLSCNLEILTPTHIKESGQPTIDIHGGAQGWDFFHMGPPDNESKPDTREYAIPSKTLKGMVRSIYQLLSDKIRAESLFGFVENNAGYMGRVNFSFAPLQSGDMKWYGMPHHYTDLLDKFHPKSANGTRHYDQYKNVRIFKHRVIKDPRIKQYPPDQVPMENDSTTTPCNCAEKGSVFTFDVNFWNLTQDELQTLVSSIILEENMAHKIGKGKFLGFGSCKISVDFGSSNLQMVDKNTNHIRDQYTDPNFKPATFEAVYKGKYPGIPLPEELKNLMALNS